MTLEALTAKISAGNGFMAVSEPGTLMVIPPGYLTIVAVFGERPCKGLRWSFVLSEAEQKITADMIGQMLLDFGADESLSKLQTALEAHGAQLPFGRGDRSGSGAVDSAQDDIGSPLVCIRT